MQKYIITEENIQEINEFLKNRNSLKIKKTLRELESFKEKLDEDSLRNELKNLLRNTGRSNRIMRSEIEYLLNKEKEDG